MNFPNKTILFCLCFGLLCQLSCSIKSNTRASFDQKIRKEFSNDYLDNLDVVLVIPGAGCPGCVSEAESFVKSNFDRSDKFLYVFSSFHSKKILKMKLGIDLASKRILLDKMGMFNTGPNYSFYPTVYYMSKGSTVDFEYLDPSNTQLLIELEKRF